MLPLIVLLVTAAGSAAEVCQSSLARTCDECMSVSPDCVWITSKATAEDGAFSRCTLQSNLPSGVITIVGGATHQEVVKDEDFRLPSDGIEPAIQIRPQVMRLKLRVNEAVTFNLSYKALANYPLDIYYLVDQTYSMTKHLNELRSLSHTLRTDLVTLTNNSRIALGYFSDKVVMPYYSLVPSRLEDPCRVLDDVPACVPGSNFVHAVSFTEDIGSFGEEIAKFEFTANLDDPEGGLDAIMQILLCDDFGWRMHSRKMIVLATDGLLHAAGDGLLGGLTQRAPADCRMRRANNGRLVYDGLEGDYPSVEEVYRRLREKKTAVLFAIQEKDDNGEYYRRMNNLLHEVSFLSLMRSDTFNNVMEVLEAGFRDVVRKVQLHVRDSPGYLQWDAVALCNGGKNRSWACWDVQLEKEYSFEVSVRLLDAPLHKRDVIRIEEMNLHEFLEIEVEYPEICDCEEDAMAAEPAVHGKLKCGVYVCDPMWVGERCDQKCDPTAGKYGNDSSSSRTCSGHGDFDMATCRCLCDKGYAGGLCQTACNTSNSKICSGNGHCTASGCQCFLGFTGDDCACPLATNSCIQPGSSAICNNHGTCKCGKCICDKNADIKYKGVHCELCTGCQACQYNEHVLDYVTGRSPPNEVHDFIIESNSGYDSGFDCIAYHSPNSTHSCTVWYKSEYRVPIHIHYYERCEPNTPYQWPIVAGSISLGILLLLLIPLVAWIIFIRIKDNREFAKFQETEKLTMYNLNPHYKDPVSTYVNPRYE